jgi:hypothetical protein
MQSAAGFAESFVSRKVDGQDYRRRFEMSRRWRLKKFSARKAMFARILTVVCIPLALGLVQWFQFQSLVKVMLVM